MSDTYRIKVQCDNCNYISSGAKVTWDLVIEKGTPVIDKMRLEECPNCGCHTLSRA